MCWAVYVDGERATSRDDLESLIGEPVKYLWADMPRLDKDHCLCPVDIAETMVQAGFWVRCAMPDDSEAGAGDYVAISYTPKT